MSKIPETLQIQRIPRLTTIRVNEKLDLLRREIIRPGPSALELPILCNNEDWDFDWPVLGVLFHSPLLYGEWMPSTATIQGDAFVD